MQEREGRARVLIKEHFSNLPSRYALSVDAHVVVKDMRLMAQVRRRDRCVCLPQTRIINHLPKLGWYSHMVMPYPPCFFPLTCLHLPFLGGRVAVDVEQGEWDADETPRSVITLSCRDRPNLLDTITRIISRLSRYPPSQPRQPNQSYVSRCLLLVALSSRPPLNSVIVDANLHDHPPVLPWLPSHLTRFLTLSLSPATVRSWTRTA